MSPQRWCHWSCDLNDEEQGQRKGLPGQGDSKDKSPGAGKDLALCEEQREASVAKAE